MIPVINLLIFPSIYTNAHFAMEGEGMVAADVVAIPIPTRWATPFFLLLFESRTSLNAIIA